MMMITRGTVLVAGTRDATAAVRATLEQLGGRVVALSEGDSLLARLEQERPDVVVLPALGLNAALERALGREKHACAVVGMVGAQPPVTHEVFDLLIPGLPDAAAQEALRLALLLGRARREAHDVGREVTRLREATSAQVQRLSGLMLTMIDRHFPGSAERSAHVAELSLQVAERFGIPDDMLPSLNLAARLRDVGRLAIPAGVVGTPGEPQWEWSITQAASQLLEPFPELAQAVELLTGVHENWDGTGHPGHLMSGQIPMRSRILRAVQDYELLRTLPNGGTQAQILERFAEQAGTLYDPLVIVHLRATLETAGTPKSAGVRLYLPVPELQVGMVLAEDLYTDSGMKLLSRGTVLSTAALEVIVRRHGQEPMYRGVAIQRR